MENSRGLALGAGMTGLESLNAGWCGATGDLDVQSLYPLTRLKSISLARCKVDTRTWRPHSLTALDSFPSPVSLNLLLTVLYELTGNLNFSMS